MRYGYRSHRNMTATRCLTSMIMGVHNETMNVLTHFIPAVYFLVQLNALNQGYAPYNELNQLSSRFFLFLAAVSIIFCLTSSAIYHLFYPMGQLSYDRLLRVDLMGIGVMIFGLTLSTAYAAFHNFEQQRHFVCTITGTLMISNLLIQMTPCYSEDRYHFHRIMMYVGTILICTGLVVYMRVFIATPIEVEEVYN
jgi:adiponectin receptor